MNPLRAAFREYYALRSRSIFVPRVDLREIMMVTFDGTVIRHVSVRNLESLRAMLAREAPRHAYYSVGLYERPAAKSMAEKGLKGAEVLFDIDADHLGVDECDYGLAWRCKSCGESGDGASPDACPKCGSQDLERLDWLSEGCLEAAKREAIRLLEILDSDLGISEGELMVYYTGHRGYHVRILSERFLGLGKEERRELASHVSGLSFDPREIFYVKGSALASPRADEGGWRGRVAREILRLLEEPGGGKAALPSSVAKRREELVRALGEGVPLINPTPALVRDLRRMAQEIVQARRVKIDEMVTPDTSRLTRIPNSLHGKTGLRAMALSPDELRDFQPLRDAVGLSGDQIRVFTTAPVPRFRVKGESFGPYESGVGVDLPMFAAALILLKGRGVIP